MNRQSGNASLPKTSERKTTLRVWAVRLAILCTLPVFFLRSSIPSRREKRQRSDNFLRRFIAHAAHASKIDLGCHSGFMPQHTLNIKQVACASNPSAMCARMSERMNTKFRRVYMSLRQALLENGCDRRCGKRRFYDGAARILAPLALIDASEEWRGWCHAFKSARCSEVVEQTQVRGIWQLERSFSARIPFSNEPVDHTRSARPVFLADDCVLYGLPGETDYLTFAPAGE